MDNLNQGIDYDKSAYDRLEGLRDFVDNINRAPVIALRRGIYQGINKDQVFTTRFDGFEIGYHLEDMGTMMRKTVYIKLPGEDIGEIPEGQIEPVCNTVMDIFIDRGQAPPTVGRCAKDCIQIIQVFVPLTMFEKNPGIVVPGSTGWKN